MKFQRVLSVSGAFGARFAMAGMLFATPAFCGLNLITNGTFQPGSTDPISNVYGVTGTFADNAWTVSSGNVDWIQGLWPGPLNVGNSVDLDGSPGVGSISQTINTVAGQTYALSFWLNANPYGDPNPKLLDVTIGSTVEPTIQKFFSTSDAWPNPVTEPAFENSWSPESLLFTAGPGTTTAITFASEDFNSSQSNGPVIGDVTVSSTPEPGFYGILALGLTGLVAAIRRRKSA